MDKRETCFKKSNDCEGLNMKLIDFKVDDFINEIDQKTATPGGGSVSSLAAAMGAALVRMVGHLTVDKKKFLALDPEIQFEFKDILAEFLLIKNELMTLIDQDTEAFNLVMSAYKLPKDTEVEKKIRNGKIKEGTLEAIRVPLKVATLAISALHHFDLLIKHCNPQTTSDLGVAVLMLSSGAEGACMNVLINLSALNDDIAKSQYAKTIEDYLVNINRLRKELLDKVYLKLS